MFKQMYKCFYVNYFIIFFFFILEKKIKLPEAGWLESSDIGCVSTCNNLSINKIYRNIVKTKIFHIRLDLKMDTFVKWIVNVLPWKPYKIFRMYLLLYKIHRLGTINNAYDIELPRY